MATKTLSQFGDDPSAVVLWTRDPISCTCVSLAPDRFEVRLVVSGVVIQCERFSDPDAASEFAVGKMRAYNGR
jgi:hypothetical protein